ncbi:hypothetical protein METBIDRAFT_40452 [Metschnikowia bicuspidata var. bicuspidata NRRL YB-4993]|uniref:Uncharacterized protein n=1 Tax=Metschnikowia bicuspidata var. bicuspidata NRRL YB-4993 TaxID=869754 RepID=A0A1A0HCT7_9ASCO|nr:hypothetical protein METBIDRAFT_40452 [Metschnikowia bicuspidata var. bicuspidata NRRL YB-4993]OBA21790.1 hypothetical protein METBIDRAFT_40452 [Metschnikowia bicuspidata var. bicuspidata NRRL YB-4993]
MPTSTSDALVAIAERILGQVAGLSTAEISKRGRKYRFVNKNFQRVREEDKHLTVCPERPQDHVSVVLAHGILAAIRADIFDTHPDLCLMIIGVARALEENHWYEEENSSVVHFDVQRPAVAPGQAQAAVRFAERVTDTHLAQGYNVLYCAKLNFLHTDHHVGSRLEGACMREYVARYFGAAALELPDVLAALKSFSHWAHIKGLLYRLGLPHMDVDDALARRFAAFPAPPPDLAAYVHARSPSGTSRFALVCKALDHLAQYKYARLVPYPHGPLFDCRWAFALCADIARDPARYHLRAKAKRLSRDPANLPELAQRWGGHIDALLLAVCLVLHVFPDTAGECFLHSRVPLFSDAMVARHADYYQQLLAVAREIDDYERKGWAPEDIVLRMHKAHVPSWHDEVARAKNHA